MKRPWACALLLLGACQAGADEEDAGGPAVDRFAGEVHLHQFPQGGHAWALFVADPVPLARVHGDQLFNLDPEPTRRAGPCSFYPNQVVVEAAPPRLVDAGEVLVTGSRRQPRIRMWFTTPRATYSAEPAPGTDFLYDGGEDLAVNGAALGLHGSLPAPLPMQVLAPDPQAPLHLPAAGPFPVRWVPAGGQLVLVRIIASQSSGRAGFLRCLSDDSGGLTVAAELVGALPPPPRDVRIEVERDEERFLPTARPGIGVLTHATYTAWQVGTD